MIRIVLDANTAIDWFVTTPEGESYSRQLEPLVNAGGIRFVVPLHFDVEVVGHLVKKHRKLPAQFPSEWLATSLEILDMLPIDITALGMNFKLMGDLAKLFNLAAYDVPYFQLARLLELPIATRDRGIITACNAWNVLHWKPA